MAAVIERRRNAKIRQEFEDKFWQLLEQRSIDWQEQDRQDKEKLEAQKRWIELKNNYYKDKNGSK